MPCARYFTPFKRFAADDLALLLRVLDAREFFHEAIRRARDVEIDVEAFAEDALDLLHLALPQEAVVDEDAGELVAQRLVQEHRRDRRIDAAREPQDHAVAAHARADRSDFRLDEGGHRPGGLTAAEFEDEIAQQRRPLRRVHDLRMELDADNPIRLVRHRGVRRIAALRDRAEAGRERRHLVAMAHPDRHRPLADAVEERVRLLRLDRRAPVLAAPVARDLAAQFLRDELHPVADAKNRDAQREQALREPGRGGIGHR